MTIRIILSECHDEIINSQNTNSLQTMLNGMECIVFPYVEGPISLENIQDDDILILGCPQAKLAPQEMDDIERFVAKGKILVLISGNLGDGFYNTNLSELARRFDLEFNENQVENYKEHEDSPSVVYVRDFERLIFSNRIYQIVYSGCSINILEDNCKIIASSSASSTPANAPIVAISKNERVNAFGGFNLFVDEPNIGIQSNNNFEFVVNFFDHVLKTIKYQQEFDKSEENDKEPEKIDVDDENLEFDTGISSTEDDHDLKILGIINGDLSRVAPKKAVDKFQVIMNMFIKYIEGLEEKIDEFWVYIKDKISLKKPELLDKGKKLLIEVYDEFNKEINRISGQVNDQHVEFCSFFDEKDFDPQSSLIDWFEAEAHLREHLDMIRNNLLALLGQ